MYTLAEAEDASTDPRSINLTVYLLKPDKLSLVEKAVGGKDRLILSPPLIGSGYVSATSNKTPDWVNDIQSIVQGPLPDYLRSASPSALLVIHFDNRDFAIAFGHAWQWLRDEWLEPDFGRRVALNALKSDEVVEIRVEQVFASWHLASERAPRASSIRKFGIQFDRDLLGMIGGVSSSKALAGSIRGSSSLRVKYPVHKLTDLLEIALDLFARDDYKKAWPEIDNISPVEDDLIIAKLNEQLDQDFADGKAQKRLVLFTPSERRDDPITVESYVIGRRTKSAPTHPYLLIGAWIDGLKKEGKEPSVKAAREYSVHLLDQDKEEFQRCSVFDCFGYELSISGSTYVLSSGTWYQVATEFITQIDRTVKSIEGSAIKLPDWSGKESEGEYNLRCCKELKFLHFDAKTLWVGGNKSQFEFCDFCDIKTKTLFFAKIPSKSSGMSHLVEQVRRTAELLFSTDKVYRKELKSKFKKLYPNVNADWLDERPKNSDWQLCLVSLGKAGDKLPFFARCSLARLYNELKARDHNVSFTAV